MESLTIELCVAEGDPYDRTLSVLAKSGDTMAMVRSLRISPAVHIGKVLYEVDRVVLAWSLPQMPMSEHMHDVWEDVEREIGYGPFDLPITSAQ